MSVNIKSERVAALVRELASRTGRSQTAAVEDAVSRRLAELDADAASHAQSRAAAAADVLAQLRRTLTADDISGIRQNNAELYDDAGLPR